MPGGQTWTKRDNGARDLIVLDLVVGVHRAGQPVVSLTEDDALSGEEVVPGFSVSVAEIFE